jgi:hypothetical protein
MIEIRDHFRHIARTISAKAQMAAGTGHASTTGQLREIIVQEFLKPPLPGHLKILSGVIVDSTGARSSQQDCIIVDTRMPLIDLGSPNTAVVVAESVIATVEVKSYLDKSQLLSALSASARTKSLKRVGELAYSKGPALIILPIPLPIITYVFAFDGDNLNTLIDHVSDYAHGRIDGEQHDCSAIIDAMCVLNKGVFLNDPRMPTIDGTNVRLPPLNEPQALVKSYACDALFAFYRRISADITYLQLRNFDLDPYYSEGDLQ